MESLECKVCLLVFCDEAGGSIPRLLSCGHTICENCAKKMLKGNQILCPQDRIPTNVPKNIESLSKNFSLLEVLEEQKTVKIEKKETIKSLNESGLDLQCRENSKHAAEFYCEQCDAELCERCFDKVHTPKMFSFHQKLQISEKPIRLPKCKTHPYNTAEFLCNLPDCTITEKVMCHTCFLSSDHKGHTYTVLLDEIQESEGLLKAVLENVKEKVGILESQIHKAANCAASFDRSNESFQNLVQKISDGFDAKKLHTLELLESFADASQTTTLGKQGELEVELVDAQILQTDIQLELRNRNNIEKMKEKAESGDVLCFQFRPKDNLRSLEDHAINLTAGMSLRIEGVIRDSVDSLSKNFSLLDVVQERKTKKVEKKAAEKVIEPVVEMKCRENPEHGAEFYCEQCDAELCNDCFNHVHQIKMFSSHEKLPISKKPFKLPKCKLHPHNTAEYFCNSHCCTIEEKTMCHACILSSDHKGHSFTELLEQIKKRQALVKLLEDVEKKIKLLESKAHKAKKCAASFSITGETFLGCIRKISDAFDKKKMQVAEIFGAFANESETASKYELKLLEEDLLDARGFQRKIEKKLKDDDDIKNADSMLAEANSLFKKFHTSSNLRSLDEYSASLTQAMELKIDGVIVTPDWASK